MVAWIVAHTSSETLKMGSTVGDRYVTGTAKATNADLDIRKVGFEPKRVKVYNKTNLALLEWNQELAKDGTEFFKTSNMASDMAYDEYTIDGDDTPDEDRLFEFTGLSAAQLVTGSNTIAVEIKQGDH